MIDDFGTGYSSLARLGELPITGVKLDRRFTSGLGTDATTRRVLRAIAELAGAYGLEVVAEGIEDAGALADVDALGCRFAQGFYIGRPAPAAATEVLLAGAPERECLVVCLMNRWTQRVVAGGCRARTQDDVEQRCTSRRGRRPAPPGAARMSRYL